jgi:hypothetical protein
VFERFFNTGSGTSRSEVGQTPYFLLPEWPTGLEVGDLLEGYTVVVDSPDYVANIVGLEESSLLIEVDTPVDTDTPSLAMDVGSPIPFVRIRRQKYNNYTNFKADLDTWLATDEAQPRWFNELRAAINPLVVNTNPTPSQVNTAKALLLELSTSLTTLSGYIDGYSASVVEDVDVLVESFREKGADRAVDLLLESRFSDFFGLDQDEVSYAGNLQKNIRAVNREDLPVRKDNRTALDEVDEQVLAEYEDVDYEFSADDVDDVDIDIPDGVSYDLR